MNVAFEDLFWYLARKSTMLDGDSGKVSADQNANLQLHFVLLAIPPAPLHNESTFVWEIWLSRSVYYARPAGPFCLYRHVWKCTIDHRSVINCRVIKCRVIKCHQTTFKLYEICQLGQFIFGKIIKIVATRSHRSKLKCTQFDFGWGSASDPAVGGHSASPDSSS